MKCRFHYKGDAQGRRHGRDIGKEVCRMLDSIENLRKCHAF
jgi:predicted methyltransferase